MLKVMILWGAIGAAALLLAVQAVPYGREHTNPPVRMEPAWDSPRTRELARLACYDCHSNETVWPWYSNIAPLSWMIQRDVEEGRRVLNFSEWDRPQEEAGEAAETVQEGEMPPWYYLPAHPEARFSASQLRELVSGLETTLGRGSEGEREEEEGKRR